MINLSGFRHVETLYESRRAIVYRAMQDDRSVIVKVLASEYPSLRELGAFRTEHQLLQDLDSSGVARTHGLIEHGRGLALVIEDFGGRSLRALLEERGRLEIGEFLAIARQVTQALADVHDANIIHKDLNPANIIYNPNDGTVKIIDFNISSRLGREQPSILNYSRLEGTLPYTSPEQTGRMNRALDYRTDFYSLGATFYELLTGSQPFRGATAMELVHSHIARAPLPPEVLRSDLPATLSRLVLKLMQKNADDRYQSARGLLHDLERCAEAWQADGHIPDFIPGEHDRSERFRIPQKLYGRDQELAALLQGFDQTCAGDTRVLMVAGYSGMGKSSLVQELRRPLAGRQGWFLRGKFEQLRRDTPYAAIIAAFSDLVKQILISGDVQHWKQTLLGALGANAGVMTDLIPDLVHIIGEQPAVASTQAAEARNRLVLTFQDFLDALIGDDTPIVLFIDDMQWADDASLDLLQRIASNPESHHLFWIGCYRDNEVGPEHPLRSTLEAIEKVRPVSTIQLQPLARHHIVELLSDAFGRPQQDNQQLARILIEKTGGNPFFVNQFLEALYQEGLIDFLRTEGAWHWDVAAIRSRNMTDNVVELMSAQIDRLDDACRTMLQLAACLGNDFDSARLALLSGATQDKVVADLAPAAAEGLIYLQDFGNDDLVQYRFLHDRVLQSAYASIPEADRKPLHLQVGRMLRDQSDDADRDALLFDIVEHLDAARDLIDDPAERHALAAANLVAGQRAKASGAFSAALGFLLCALDLRTDDAWSTHYDHTRALHLELGEVQFLNGDVDASEAHLDQVIQNSRTVLEKIPAYGVRIATHNARGLFADCIPVCLEALGLLGITIPDSPEEIGAAIGAEMGTIMGYLSQYPVEALADLPEMSDPKMREAIKVLVLMTSTAFIGNPTLYPLVVVKQVSLSIEHGNAPESAVSYSSFAVANAPGAMENLDFNWRFGLLCQDVLSDHYVKGNEVNIRFVVGTFVQHWKNHLRGSLDHLRRCYQLCLELGNSEYFIYSTVFHSLYSVLLWEDLPAVQKQCDNLFTVYRRIGLADAAGSFLMARQVAINLQLDGEPDQQQPWMLVGDTFDETVIAPVWTANHDYLSLAAFNIMKLVLNHLFDRHDDAATSAEAAGGMLSANTGMAQLAEHNLFDSLHHLHAALGASGDQRQAHLDRVAENQEAMTRWAASSPDNCAHRVALVDAVTASIQPDARVESVTPMFEEAARQASASGFRLHEGLAWLGLGRFLLRRGMERAARLYLLDAAHTWERMGAKALVTHLHTVHRNVLGGARGRVGDPGIRTTGSSELGGTITTSSTVSSGGQLDLDSFLKAGHLISSALKMDDLLVELVRVMVENAGAQAGYFLVRSGGGWRIEASQRVGSDSASLVGVPLSASPEVPRSVLDYVARTRRPQICDDAWVEGDFVSDPVIAERRVRSLLCLPVVHKSALRGVIYLENSLSAAAFTSEHILTVELLARQAAISLDNAQLYQKQERQAEAFRRFVPHEFLEFLKREAIEDVQRGDSVQGDFTVLFTDLRNFTRLSESLTARQTFEFLNAYFDLMSPVVQKHGGFIDKFIGDAIMALFPAGADKAVLAGIEMLRVLDEWNARRDDGRSIAMGVGIHSGPLMLGTVGSRDRMESTVIGDTVNLASRIESMTKVYDAALLISDASHARLNDPAAFPARIVDLVRAAGKSTPNTIYEVFSDQSPAVRKQKLDAMDTWNRGIQQYRAARFDAAAATFASYEAACPGDMLATMYRARCVRHLSQGVPEDWDGVIDLAKS